jgi:adenylate cyclase
MVEESFKRKLTTMFSADVEGYSRLMGQDEAGTVKTLKAYQGIMTELIKQHRGRVVDSPGDNVLAEFTSVVDAVQCAVSVQKELQARNAELPEDRRMAFRIGVNLGDVIEEEDRIYGDGVNIAARLEALADPGGICISKTAFDQIETKLPLGYEFLGEQTVKNISKPVGAYRVLMEPRVTVAAVSEEKKVWPVRRTAVLAGGIVVVVLAIAAVIWNFYLRPTKPVMEPASVERMAFPLPEKPSIAVLPFDNLSGDPEQEYIADGITENIITALSKISEMFVIDRHSTFTYKGKSVKVKQVSENLGVRYVLEGSLLKSGERVRINAQLIDATSGHHLWAEQYDRNMRDFFDLMDEITRKIVLSLQVELTKGERAYVWHEATDNFEAWGHAARGYSLFQHNEKEDNEKARELFKSAIKIDPGYSTAWTYLAWTHWHDAWLGWSESPDESISQAIELAKKAQTLDDTQAEVHSLFSDIYLHQKQYEKAIAEAEKGVTLSPNNSLCHVYLAWALHNAGRFEEAVEVQKRAMRLSPYYPTWYLSNLGESLTMAGHYEEAITVNQQLLERSQKEKNPFWATAEHAWLAIGYSMLGREEEARFHVAEGLKTQPDWTMETERKFYSYKNPADLERHLDALRKAGLPEN